MSAPVDAFGHPPLRYLVFSDGSETGGTPAYGIAYEDTRMPHDWVWEETLPTADQAEASRLVAARGYVATPISGGWYGDARDDTYALLVPGGQCEACGDKLGGHAPDCATLRR